MESIISRPYIMSSSGTGPGTTKGRPQSRQIDPGHRIIDKEKYSISISFVAIERNPSKKKNARTQTAALKIKVRTKSKSKILKGKK